MEEFESTKPAWVMANENGCTLEEFKDSLTEEEQADLISFLRACSRWNDIQSLMNDPVYGEEATNVYENQQQWTAYQAKRQQEIAALSEIYQQITMEFRKIWWIADVHYPYRSEHVPDSNMAFTGDGMGLAYMRVLADDDIELVVCDAPEFREIFKKFGIVEDKKTNAQTLLKAVETFVAFINGKFERFHGIEARGHLNHD